MSDEEEASMAQKTSSCPLSKMFEEILKIDNTQTEVEDHPVWPSILSYLSLADLESFAKCSCKLRHIVNTYLESGHALMIDAKTVSNYPFDVHRDLYARYGSCTTNLAIIGIYEVKLNDLAQIFFNIIKLTLIKNVIVSSKNVKDANYTKLNFLRKLSLIDTLNLNDSWLLKWLEEMPNVKSLHLEGNSSICLTGQFRSLQSLKLVRQMVSVNNLELPVLKHLTIDLSCNVLSKEFMKSLESLRVVGGVCWKDMEQIKALNLKSVDVYYYDPPSEQNLILKLNDDCLLHLQTFLSTKDWMCLRETHPRFEPLRILELFLDDDLAADFQYQFVGKVVSRLTYLRTNCDQTFQELIPHFTNLTVLDLDASWKSTSLDIINYIPDGLKELIIHYDLLQCPTNTRDLFRRLNPTLTRLTIVGGYGTKHLNAIDELTNIRYFSFTHLMSPEFLKFLWFNVSHMKGLRIGIVSKELLPLLSEVMDQMRNLTNLTIYDFSFPGLSLKVSFPILQDLKLINDTDTTIHCVDLVNSLNHSCLKKLYYSGPPFDLSSLKPDIMANLKELFLEFKNGQRAPNTFPAIFGCAKVQVLFLPGFYKNEVLPLVKRLKNLTHLTFGNEYNCEELHLYLSSVNRKVFFNNFILGKQ